MPRAARLSPSRPPFSRECSSARLMSSAETKPLATRISPKFIFQPILLVIARISCAKIVSDSLKIANGVSSNEVPRHGDEDYGVRDVDAFSIVSYEAAPSGVTGR